MSAAVKAPPRKAGAPRASKAAAPKAVEGPQKSVLELRTEGLMGLAQLGQGVCLMMGQYADAATIAKHAPPFLGEVAKLADEYEQVAKPIDLLIKVGPFAGLIATGMPFFLQIAANHKMFNAANAQAYGVVPPELLDAQMKAEVLRMQATAMREQQQAMADAQKAQAEYEEMRRTFDGEAQPS